MKEFFQILASIVMFIGLGIYFYMWRAELHPINFVYGAILGFAWIGASNAWKEWKRNRY